MNLDLRLFDVCVIWRLVVYGCQIVLGRHFKLFLFLIFWLKLHKFSLNFRRVHVGVEVSHDRKDDTHSHQERCEQHVFCPLQQHINTDELEAIRMPTVSDIWLGFRQKKKQQFMWYTWSGSEPASATISTMMFPTATVNSQPAWRTDFILLGA